MKIDKEELRQAMEEALNQEVEELLHSTADDETIEREAEVAMGRMDWKRIYRETKTKQHFFGWSKVALIFFLVIIAGSVSVYAATKIFRTGIQWIVKQGEGEDDFLFEVENPVATVVPTGGIKTEESAPKTENAPKGIERRYKPVYIAKGFFEVGEKRKEGLYRITYKNKEKTLFFYQRTKTTETVAEPILSEKESIMVGGYHGVIGYRAKKKLLQYANEIISIWNATQEKVDNNLFCIKNAQWNQNLSKKETVNFGMIIKSDQQPQIPDLAFVCGKGEGYSISVISEDGNIWYYIDEGTKIEVLNSLSNDVYMFNIDNSCISEQVIYGGNEEKVTTYSFADQDENDEETMIELFSLGRGKKISDGWKHNYYYQKVTDSSYYYVGCKAEYLIKNQGKSADALYNYRREIDSTRSYENAVNSACLRYGISVGVAVPLVLVNIALPETAIVSLLVVAVNGVGTSALKGIVSNCVKNYKSYNKVKDYYKTVKKYAV